MRTVAIDLGGTAVKLGVYERGTLVRQDESAAADGELGLEAVAARVGHLLAGDRPTSVGIAVPGVVDASGTRLLAAHDKYAQLHGVDLAAWSRSRLGAPAIVENDARAALAGELATGAGRGNRDAVLIVLGTGIGTAAVIDGRLVRGRHGHGGILGGHVTVELDGPRCNCGNIGCAEAVASTWALNRDAAAGRMPMGDELSRRFARHGRLGIRDLVETRDEHESAVVLDRFVRAWAAVTVTACHAFDPDLVIVTGGVMRAADVILPALRERVHHDLWSSSFRPAFVTPDDPSTSVLRGLVALASELDQHSTAKDGHDDR